MLKRAIKIEIMKERIKDLKLKSKRRKEKEKEKALCLEGKLSFFSKPEKYKEIGRASGKFVFK